VRRRLCREIDARVAETRRRRAEFASKAAEERARAEFARQESLRQVRAVAEAAAHAEEETRTRERARRDAEAAAAATVAAAAAMAAAAAQKAAQEEKEAEMKRRSEDEMKKKADEEAMEKALRAEMEGIASSTSPAAVPPPMPPTRSRSGLLSLRAQTSGRTLLTPQPASWGEEEPGRARSDGAFDERKTAPPVGEGTPVAQQHSISTLAPSPASDSRRGSEASVTGEGEARGDDAFDNEAEAVALRLRSMLHQGGEFIKFGRAGKPHVRHVCVTVFGDLHWSEQRMDADVFQPSRTFVRLQDVTRVEAGKTTEVMRREHARRAPDELCFSVVTPERTLDLEATTPTQRDDWLEALRAAVAEARHGLFAPRGSAENPFAYIERGSWLTKHGRAGKPHRRFVNVFRTRIFWGAQAVTAVNVATTDSQCLRVGSRSRSLARSLACSRV
jgi:hypothetical protein